VGSHNDTHSIVLRSHVGVAGDGCVALQRVSCHFSAIIIKFVIADREIAISQMICHGCFIDYS